MLQISFAVQYHDVPGLLEKHYALSFVLSSFTVW